MVTLSLRLGGKSVLDLITTRKLTELKHQLTDLFICSLSCLGLKPFLRKDGANATSIWSPQRNCHHYNDALQNTKTMI